jgi:beta-glucosidase
MQSGRGVNNFDRVRWDDKGWVLPPPETTLSIAGHEVYPPSLANAVRFAHAATGVPILVTEHGMCTDDDAQRPKYLPSALAALQTVITEGVPVKGYLHWSLLDNFEWFPGFKIRFGLCSVDRKTFKRTRQPGASVLGAIARRNEV